MPNRGGSEIVTVRTLLDTLYLQGVCFSLDALHTQKTVEQIIASGNDDLIGVKANQLKLFNEIAHQFDQAPVLRDPDD
jgi:predicted transposase YbfD/YdcC